MKKLLLLIAVCIPLLAYSQRFKGGPLLGINASQIDGDRMGGYNKAGLVGGAFVYTDFRNNWGGQLELRYAAKGSASALRSVDKIKNRLQYIELPILVTYDFSRKINLQGGGVLGYLFSAQQNNGYGYEDIGPVDKYAFDACIGGSYQFLENLSINARFAYSVLPIYAQYPGATGSLAWYNNVVTFAFYYRIGDSRY